MQSQIKAAEVYDNSFFDYADRASASSARYIVPEVQSLISDIKSVVDFGCARGVWLHVWRELGAQSICGLDGDYVDQNRLQIPPDAFITHDLSQPIDLGRRFDLVQSLEVAEHLPESSATGFVETLTSHGDVILFSAAPPGQGGAHHINEQPYEYWRDLFAERRYAMFDCLRPRIASQPDLQAWYRFNSFIYAHEDKIFELSSEVRAAEIPRNKPVPDISPVSYRLRKAIVTLLPGSVQSSIAAAVGRWRGIG